MGLQEPELVECASKTFDDDLGPLQKCCSEARLGQPGNEKNLAGGSGTN